MKAETRFRERNSAKERIYDIIALSILANEPGRATDKAELAKRDDGVASRWLRVRLAQGVMIDGVTGAAPLFGQLHPDTRGSKARVPRKIDHAQNAERPLASVHRRNDDQNLCRTGLT